MFKRAIVLDIITHPGLLTDDIIKKLTDNNSNFKIAKNKKKDFIKTLPSNSIIGEFIDSKNIFIALPFFSSHMSLPLKIQEEVWIYEDQTSSKDFENEYYWVSRIHGTNFYEDANYTHTDRKFLRTYDEDRVRKNILLDENNKVAVALFNNGPIRGEKNTDKSYEENLNLLDKKRKSSLNLAPRHILEDVPRTLKNPGDYIIQGSNNTLIRLGTNHIRRSNDNFLESYNTSVYFQETDNYSGTIDIVAGRAALSQGFSCEKKYINYIKDSEQLFSKFITSKAYKNSQFIMYNENQVTENLKDPDYYLGFNHFNFAEGDPDFFTDISRILVSEYINGDTLLNYSNLYTINQQGQQQLLDNTKKRGYIISKSDEIRLIARNTVITKSHDRLNQLESSNNFEGSGSIRLIKEGNNSIPQGYIVLDETGNISIDGPAIVLGNKEREKSNGKGDNIYLGNDAVEPGVLGWMLKNKLENFMDETIRALNIIGLCLKELDTHVHSYAGPAGLTLQPIPGSTPSGLTTFAADNTNFVSYSTADNNATERSGSPGDIEGNYGKIGSITATSKKLEDKINGIKDIRDSLSEILSTMVKTL